MYIINQKRDVVYNTAQMVGIYKVGQYVNITFVDGVRPLGVFKDATAEFENICRALQMDNPIYEVSL